MIPLTPPRPRTARGLAGESAQPAASAVLTSPARYAEWLRLARLARTLSWLTLAWLGIEAGIAIGAAVIARSIALLGFGLDSGIEALASVIVIWRFTGTRLVLTAGTAVFEPALGLAKQRIGTRLGSSATAGEGTQNLLCAYLALAVFAGLAANTMLGAWWLDGVVALGIAGWAVVEGRRARAGRSCGCACQPGTPC